ncbi:MAG TPA: gamma-glutamyl-gamma-aminobutyrate hydrolase family protein [Bryobacteraceae bacterium]|nr:gamma-glutamyl-gamma-aminobutyrate hydrolase family protein [Bryobacteraceae bacterium]
MHRIAITFANAEKAEPYEKAIRLVGLEPVPNPDSLAGLGGLLLTGGSDLDPALYHQQPHPKTDRPNEKRDRRERRLLDEALRENKPVFGICRGLQLFNVHHGGSLLQHIESGAHSVKTHDPAQDVHPVKITPGTRLAAIVGRSEYPVNSRHHQAIAELGEKLCVSAVAPDGMIEAVERPDQHFALAVQWHPEDRCFKVAEEKRLFEAFAAAVRSE